MLRPAAAVATAKAGAATAKVEAAKAAGAANACLPRREGEVAAEPVEGVEGMPDHSIRQF